MERTYPKDLYKDNKKELEARKALEEAGKQITGCCKRDKPLWIGVGVSTFIVLMVSIVGFNLIQIKIDNGAILLFYIGHGVMYVGMVLGSWLSYKCIKAYCDLVKDNNAEGFPLTMGLFFAIVIVLGLIVSSSYLVHDYDDAILYNTNDKERLAIIHNMDCRTYLQFYDDAFTSFKHDDRISHTHQDQFEIHYLGLCGKQ